MMDDLSNYTQANRAAWNEAAPRHEAARMDALLAGFRQPGYSTLDEFATRALQQVGVTGKRVAQLACNNGVELLSIKNMGAGRCDGFDISDAFIRQAVRLAEVARSTGATDGDVHFHRMDLYDIPKSFDEQFDLIYISIGVLGWLPDIARFMGVATRLMAPGAHLVMYEMHPILGMFDQSTKNPLELVYSYFRKEPYVEADGLDYFTKETYKSKTSYWFQHTLGDILTAVLGRGLRLLDFEEYDHDISAVFDYLGKEAVRPPLSFMLVAQK